MVLKDISSFDGFIFDLDGTLLASTRLWYDVYREALARFGIDMPADYVEHVNHLNIAGGTAYTAARFGIPGGQSAVERVWRELAGDAYANTVELTPHAKELLYALKSRGKRLAIATALDRDLAEACLSRHGVWGLFEAYSDVGETGKDKSAPDVYLAAAAAIKLPPERCVVFEDGAVKPGFSWRASRTRTAGAERAWRRCATGWRATSAAMPDRNNTNRVQRRRFPPEPRHSPC